MQGNASEAESFLKSLTPDLFGFIFALPAMFKLGDHWYLTNEEEKDIADRGWIAFQSIPKKKRAEYEVWLNNYLPGLLFVMTFAVLFGQRVAESVEIINQRKGRRRNNLRVMPNNGENNNESNNQSSSETSSGRTESPNPGNKARPNGFLSDDFSEYYGGYSTRN